MLYRVSWMACDAAHLHVFVRSGGSVPRKAGIVVRDTSSLCQARVLRLQLELPRDLILELRVEARELVLAMETPLDIIRELLAEVREHLDAIRVSLDLTSELLAEALELLPDLVLRFDRIHMLRAATRELLVAQLVLQLPFDLTPELSFKARGLVRHAANAALSCSSWLVILPALCVCNST